MTKEQRLNRRLTRLFIKTSPHNIRMVSYERLKDDMGNWRYVKGDIRPTQTVRFIESGQVGTNAAVNAQGVDGVMREIEFQMVADHCADIRLHDRFEHEGVEYEVMEVWPDNGWEKRASVVRRAS